MKFKSGSKVIELTPKNFSIKNGTVTINHPALDGTKKGMIAYVASWCGFCVKLTEPYSDVSKILGDSFPLFYIDCAKYEEFSRKNLNIQSFPTVMYIDRTGKPYKNYTKERTEIAMLDDICSEAQTCRRTK